MSCGSVAEVSDFQKAGFFPPATPFVAPFQNAKSYIREIGTTSQSLQHMAPQVVQGRLPPVLGPCRWGMLVFDAHSCPGCDEQWRQVESFLRTSASRLDSLVFFSVLPDAEDRTPKGRNHADVIVFDTGNYLAEQFGVIKRPSLAVIDENAVIRAWRPGLVALDSPSFEALSVLISSSERPSKSSAVVQFLSFFLLATVLVLVCILARRCAAMIYRSKSNN